MFFSGLLFATAKVASATNYSIKFISERSKWFYQFAQGNFDENAFLKLAEPFSGHCLTKKNKNAIHMSDITLPSVSAAKHQLSRACAVHWPVCD